jgi:hypothetical protein
MAGAFALDEERVDVPAGASARTRRHVLRHAGRPVLALTAGAFRPCLFPVYTPAGFAVTAEAPADHPHHSSIWIGADHIHLLMPSHEGRDEVYAYNCYVDDVFQGRAPGRIVVVSMHGEAEPDGFAFVQSIQWRGPREWGASEGRLLLDERRTTRVRAVDGAYLIDVRSVLAAATQRIVLGPTRHAYFNFRLAPSMCVDNGGVLCDDGRLRARGSDVDVRARWVAASGPVGGGHEAGIALRPAQRDAAWWWFVSDWGVATASPCRDTGLALTPGGASLDFAARYAVFDGRVDPQRCAQWLEP